VAAEGEQREAMRGWGGGTRTRSGWIEAAPSATAPCPGFRSNRHDDRLGVVVDADAFDSGARQPTRALEVSVVLHPVLRLMVSSPWTARNHGADRVQGRQPSQNHPRIEQESDITAHIGRGHQRRDSGLLGARDCRVYGDSRQPRRIPPTHAAPGAGRASNVQIQQRVCTRGFFEWALSPPALDGTCLTRHGRLPGYLSPCFT
jgi:hypothetical protein